MTEPRPRRSGGRADGRAGGSAGRPADRSSGGRADGRAGSARRFEDVAGSAAADSNVHGRSGYTFSLEDVAFLCSGAGQEALRVADGMRLMPASLLADLTALRKGAGLSAAAVLETALLRRRAVPKFGPAAAGWLLTEGALQQGTPLLVAQHRARRLAGLAVHDVTCSIGADLIALGEVARLAIGSDLDPVRVAMTKHNLGVDQRVFVADALRPTSRNTLIYADPARRDDSGRRITSADTVPSVADLDEVYVARPPVLRLPPGIDYQALRRPGEVEIVSLDGAAKEAVLWPVELAGVARRASVLSSSGASFEVSSDEPADAEVSAVRDWIIDPDAAVVRAGLVRHYAARHQLAQLDEHLAYLTGVRPPDLIRAFRVLDAAPFAESTVAGWIRRDGTGTVEIKQRGTSVVPDELRLRLRPAMTSEKAVAATLIIARVGDSPMAYWCRAVDGR